MDRRMQLRNTFFLLRHGHSIANEQGRIVSEIANGISGFGLAREGTVEVRASLRKHGGALRDVTRIYSSDFLRTRQTAEIASEILRVPVEFSPSLRERGFGDWEGTSNENYQRVWERDCEDASHCEWNVESVASVAERMTDLVREIDDSGAADSYLLVSHGDPLQILMTAARGIDLRLHREVEAMATAEVRLLGAATDSIAFDAGVDD